MSPEMSASVERIVATCGFARGSFALVLVTGPDELGTQVLEEVRRHLPPERGYLRIRLDRDGVDFGRLVAEGGVADPVLLVQGLESVGVRRRAELEEALNLQRDRFAGLSAAAVLWVPRGELPSFQRRCADLFQWRSALVEVEPADLPLPGDAAAQRRYLAAHPGAVRAQLSLENLAADVPSLREEPNQGLLRLHLARVWDRFRPLAIAGVDWGAVNERAALSLDAVYTPLTVLAPDAGEPDERLAAAAMRAERPPRPALAELDSRDRLVLLGEPGGGKSTFIGYVALCMAGEMLGRSEANLAALRAPLPGAPGEKKSAPQPWSHGPMVPVCVLLREFAARGLPSTGEGLPEAALWDFIVRELEATGALAGFGEPLREIFVRSGGLVLVDGLDEVPDAGNRREQIKQAVVDFATSFPKCRMVLTSRTYAWENQDWALPGFRAVRLAPFSRPQVDFFVDRWHDHVAAVRGRNPEQARGRAAELRALLARNERLGELSTRPLLLTLIASLYAWRQGSLPEDRGQLYHEMVDVLLDRWERAKVALAANVQPSLLEYLRIGRDRMRRFLEDVAFEVHEKQAQASGTADIKGEVLREGLVGLGGPDVWPKRLEEYLRDRAGLLVPRGNDVYAFPHRTFQEFLAAGHLCRDPKLPKSLAALVGADPQRWREVALLAGASSMPYALLNIAHALCPKPPEPDVTRASEQVRAAHIAAQMLAEAQRDSSALADEPELAQRLRTWLVAILERELLPALERVSAGLALAKLGDPRFDATLWMLPKDPLLGFVRIDAGEFEMGNDKGQEVRDWVLLPEAPRHRVKLEKYWLARWPVSVGQWKAYVAEMGKPPGDSRSTAGAENLPVALVSCREAVGYARWLDGKLQGDPRTPDALKAALKSGMRVTLPSEAEWERGARGERARKYPWEGEFDAERANCEMTVGEPSPVGCHRGGATPEGIEELAGNVWEWTRSKAGEYSYPATAQDRAKREDLSGPEPRVVRGGSWHCGRREVRGACRFDPQLGARFPDLGFRLAVSPVGS